MAQLNYPSNEVNEYSYVFVVEGAGMISKVKIRVIQEMIKIIRPSRCTIENIKSILYGLDQMESSFQKYITNIFF